MRLLTPSEIKNARSIIKIAKRKYKFHSFMYNKTVFQIKKTRAISIRRTTFTFILYLDCNYFKICFSYGLNCHHYERDCLFESLIELNAYKREIITLFT